MLRIAAKTRGALLVLAISCPLNVFLAGLLFGSGAEGWKEVAAFVSLMLGFKGCVDLIMGGR